MADRQFKWSKVKFDEYGLGIRLSKCGRAKIVKLNEPSGSLTLNEYLPILDDTILPRYFRLNDAKTALDNKELGLPLPKVGRPTFQQQARTPTDDELRNAAGGVNSWEDVKAFFQARRGQQAQASAKASGKVPQNPFEVLGLDETATKLDCKKAYRKLQAKFHPDHNPGDDVAAAKFRAVTTAWEEIQEIAA